MQLLVLALILVSLSFIRAETEIKFDPNDCYEPGTIFEENEKNLGYCPCKYGFHGPFCFHIHDCVIGELRTENCTQDIKNDYDLQWRCAASKEEIVKICTCPDGFRGETCEFIMENTVSTYWKSAVQSQKFFEVIYNKSDSLIKVIGTKTCRIVIEYRRLIMFVIFVLILELAWRFTKRQQKQHRQNVNCHLMKPNDTFNLDNLKNSNLYYPLPKYDLSSLEEADRLPEKKALEEDSVSRFTEVSEVSDDDVEVTVTENKVIVSKPHLHI
ncbi:unnamed protein product [Caenorhabditis brenneri]